MKSTYQYVLDLKDRLQQVCEVAHQNLREAQRTQKNYFDAKARDRVFKPGEKVFRCAEICHVNALLIRYTSVDTEIYFLYFRHVNTLSLIHI